MTTPTVTEKLLAGIFDQIERMANALDALAADKQPAAPNLVRDLAGFADFDWASIGAHVAGYDQFGPTMVEYRGQTYKRRSPENEYGAAIWFNRSIGKDADGRNRYERLITFKEMRAAKPISRSAEALAATPKPGNGKTPTPAPATKAPAPPADAARQAARAEEALARDAFLAAQSEKDFAGLKSASEEPQQAAALKAAAAGKPARAQRPVWTGPDAAKAWALAKVDGKGAPVFASDHVVEAAYNRIKDDYTSRSKSPTPAGFFDQWYAEVMDRAGDIPF